MKKYVIIIYGIGFGTTCENYNSRKGLRYLPRISGRFSPFIVSYLDHGYVKSPFLSKGYLYKEVILLVNFSCR